MVRRVVVMYQVADNTVTETYTYEYENPGDCSMSWSGRSLLLKMRRGWNDRGERVLSKTFLQGWTAETFAAQEEGQ